MKTKFLTAVMITLLITGCSGGPSESVLADLLQSSVRDDLKSRMSAMTFFGGDAAKKVAKDMGIPDPETIIVSDLNIQDQNKKDNGDYVSKITYVVSDGKDEKKFSSRITTTEVDGKLKIISSEDL